MFCLLFYHLFQFIFLLYWGWFSFFMSFEDNFSWAVLGDYVRTGYGKYIDRIWHFLTILSVFYHCTMLQILFILESFEKVSMFQIQFDLRFFFFFFFTFFHFCWKVFPWRKSTINWLHSQATLLKINALLR